LCIAAKYREFGADERWYFFTTREQKYSIGNRPNRTTVNGGSWKATGPQKLIHSVKDGERTLVGRARTLVFYKAPPKETGLPKGKRKQAQSEEKTSWTMFEYENLTSEEEAADRNVNKVVILPSRTIHLVVLIQLPSGTYSSCCCCHSI
jgi:hypothetical protein